MKNMKTRYSIFALFLALGINANGQDIHFSQSEFSPMTLNPALTGTDAPIRAGVKFRNQWPIIGPSYNTTQGFADIRFGEDDTPKQDFLSLGINLYNDMAAGTNLMTNKGEIHLAYHMGLDENSRIGAGLYVGGGQRFTNGKGKWESQYDGMTYNESAASGEDFENRSFGFIDAGFGLDYRYRQGESSTAENDQKEFNAGFAVYHINRPNNAFIAGENYKLPIRFSYFVNGNIGLRQKRNTLMPGLYINHQGSAFEIMYGTYYGYIIQEGSKITGFRKPTMIAGGLFHRFNDAVIVKGLLEIKSIAVGMSYDINLSRLTPTSRSVGGFEIFVMYRARYSKRIKDDGTL